LEAQVKDLSAKLEEAEAFAQKGGKRVVQKLEQRVTSIFFKAKIKLKLKKKNYHH
jgi:hypothetical protein